MATIQVIDVPAADGPVLPRVCGDGAWAILLLGCLLPEACEHARQKAETAGGGQILRILRTLGPEPRDVVPHAVMPEGDADPFSGWEIDLINALGDRNGAVPELVSEALFTLEQEAVRCCCRGAVGSEKQDHQNDRETGERAGQTV